MGMSSAVDPGAGLWLGADLACRLTGTVLYAPVRRLRLAVFVLDSNVGNPTRRPGVWNLACGS
jgi:hypothetical protein